MRRGTSGRLRRLIFLAVAAALAGCGGSLTAGHAPVADARPSADGGIGGLFLPDADWPRDRIAFDGPGTQLCPDRIADRVAGTTCQFSIPDAATCTGIGIRILVLIDGAGVPQWEADGWTYTDATETAIELHGAACERANQSPTGVTIWFTFVLP